MNLTRRATSWTRPGLLALGVLLVLPPPSRAAELAAFVSGAYPAASWGRGFGGSLTITVFNLVGLEAEVARQGGEATDSSMWTVSGRAYVGPSFGRWVPYLGLSTGFYHQSVGNLGDSGRIGGVFFGTKFKLPLGVIVKAEYQWVDLPSAVPLKMDGRYYLGAGLGF
jgi:hypothetical protein